MSKLPRGAQAGGSTGRICFFQNNTAKELRQEMRGYEVWEEKGFICSSGVSVIAGSDAVLQGTSKKLPPKKDIFALVSVAGGSRRWLDEQHERSILGQSPPRVQEDRWHRSAGRGRLRPSPPHGSSSRDQGEALGEFCARGPSYLGAQKTGLVAQTWVLFCESV